MVREDIKEGDDVFVRKGFDSLRGQICKVVLIGDREVTVRSKEGEVAVVHYQLVLAVEDGGILSQW